ncbi:MAG: DUF1385 domain-containing protein [Deltaproteobacteria bacterium]|nr:DUF1385 domain-containing protein [Deltaproteobacteria bacterium]
MEPGELVLGGQAVIEGVMMKGPERFSVAVRKASGEIRVKDFPITVSPARLAMSKMPLLRGIVTMAAMLVIGYRALQYSADEAIEDAEEADRKGKGLPPAEEKPEADAIMKSEAVTEAAGKKDGNTLAMAGALALALLLGITLFFWLPLLATRGLAALVPALSGRVAFNLVDGVLRLLAFVGYILAISTMKDIRRIFQYHGAEHKVVNAYEGKAVLSPEAVAPYCNLHPRCGTSFLLFVMAVSIVVFSMIPHESSLAVKAGMRLVLLPAIAGISYEALRLTARKAESPFFRAIIAPGLLLQRLTTREPDLSQIEVAIASFRRVVPGGGREAGLVE